MTNPLLSRKRLHIFSVSLVLLQVLVISGIFLSCNEDPSQLGLGLLPDEDNPDVRIDSFQVDAYTIGPERIVSSNKTVVSLGCYYDPVFGNFKSDFMIELTPTFPLDNIPFGEDIFIDSVHLIISYSGMVGDTFYVPQFEVYELTSPLIDSLVYYSDTDPAGMTGGPNLAVSEVMLTDTLELTTQLSNAFGYSLLEPAIAFDSLFFENDSAFDSRFYGLYVKALCPDFNGSIITTNNIALKLQYHTGSDPDTVSYIFIYDNGSYGTSRDQNVGIFMHDYSTGNIPHLNDFNVQDTAIYIESMGGTQGIIDISGLDELKQQLGKILVNKAELFIPAFVDSADLVDFPVTMQLGLRKTGDGDDMYIADDILYQYSSYSTAVTGTHLNGRFNYSRRGFDFYLTKAMQNFFDDDNESVTSFRLYSAWLNTGLGHTDFSAADLNRVILGSGTNPNRKITFKLAYTIL